MVPVQPEPSSLEPTRLSRRLRGETALSAEAAAAAGRAEAEAEGRARTATVRKQLTLVEGQHLAAPFTLWSIGALHSMVVAWSFGWHARAAVALRVQRVGVASMGQGLLGCPLLFKQGMHADEGAKVPFQRS